MRIVLSFAILAVMVFALTSVSASPICSTVQTTFVAGRVYDQSSGNNISGANVDVTCNGHPKSTTSDADGGYSVQYLNPDCKLGDNVTVSATQGSLSGNNYSAIWSSGKTQIGCLELIADVACGNVPLIPEFGLVVGTLTVLSAIGVFFLVRRN